MTSKPYTQRKVTVSGKDYILQSVPIRSAMRMRQEWSMPDGEIDDIKMAEQILQHVVVDPKCKIEDFDTVFELQTLVTLAVSFMIYGEPVGEAVGDLDAAKNS